MALKVLEGLGVCVDVEGESGLDGDVEDHETLGAQPVGQDLNGVADEEAGPSDGVEDAKHPNEEDHGDVGARRAILIVEGRREGPEDEGAEHARRGDQEGGAAAELVDEQSHGDGDDEGEAHLAGRQTQLLSRAFDAGGLVEQVGIVGDDGVARPLREDTEREEDGEAVAVALGAEEVEIAAVLLVLVLERDRLLDLAELVLDGRVVLVAVGVVLGEDLERPVVLVLCDQVTGRLGHPEDEGQLDDRRGRLEQRGDTPGPVVRDVVGAKGDPGDHCARWASARRSRKSRGVEGGLLTQSTNVPQAVVDGGETPAVLGMAQLSEKHG